MAGEREKKTGENGEKEVVSVKRSLDVFQLIKELTQAQALLVKKASAQQRRLVEAKIARIKKSIQKS